MGVFSGPELVTAGLVFGYDSGSVMKSWRGAPATNLFTETNLNNWSKSATVATSNFVAPFDITTYLVEDDNASAWESIDRNVTVANDSASYTLSLFVRKTYGGVSARLGFNSGFDTGGTTVAVNQRFNSDTGVATNGIVIDYGDWWYWYFTITNNSSGNTNLYCSFYPATGPYNSSDASSAVGTAVVGGFMLVAGSTAARFVAGARSNTQVLLDQTRLNTITAASLTYASDGTFSFNGSSNLLTIPENSIFNTQTPTVEVWVKTNATTQNGFFFEKGDVNTQYALFQEGSNIVWRQTTNVGSLTATAASYINTSQYAQIVGTYTAGDRRIYVNGVQVAADTLSYTIPTNTSGCSVGVYGGATGSRGYYFNGTIGAVRVYNRALTEAEVRRNFNALRGRFGI